MCILQLHFFVDDDNNYYDAWDFVCEKSMVECGWVTLRKCVDRVRVHRKIEIPCTSLEQLELFRKELTCISVSEAFLNPRVKYMVYSHMHAPCALNTALRACLRDDIIAQF
jgi:hypothetical protein